MTNIFTPSQRVHPLSSSTGMLDRSCQYQASSRRHRLWLTTKILGVSALAIIGLFVFVIMDLKLSLLAMKREKGVKADVEWSIKVADLIHALQVERGLTVLSISSNQTRNVTDKLKEKRLQTDASMDKLKDHKENFFGTTFKANIESHRKSIGLGENSTIKGEIQFYTNIIEDSIQWLFESFAKKIPEEVTLDLLGYQMFLTAKDMTGIERALGGSFFATGHFNTTELLWYAEKYKIGKKT